MKEGYLSFEEVKGLLPIKYVVGKRVEGCRNVFETGNGSMIAFSKSKEFESGKWWYSLFIYDLLEKGVNDVCFVLGNHGIVIVSIELLLEYAKFANYNENYAMGKRYFIRIRKEGTHLVMYQSGHKDIEITDKLISV
jgi:hypothetical protein